MYTSLGSVRTFPNGYYWTALRTRTRGMQLARDSDDTDSVVTSTSGDDTHSTTSDSGSEDDCKHEGGRPSTFKKDMVVLFGKPLAADLQVSNTLSGAILLLVTVIILMVPPMLFAIGITLDYFFQWPLPGCDLVSIAKAAGRGGVLCVTFLVATAVFLVRFLRSCVGGGVSKQAWAFWLTSYCFVLGFFLMFMSYTLLFLPLGRMQDAMQLPDSSCLSDISDDVFYDDQASGYLAMHGNIVFILQTPLWIPEARLMPYYLFSWIGFVFLVVTFYIGHHPAASEQYEYNFDLVVGVLFLSVSCNVANLIKRRMDKKQTNNFELDQQRQVLSNKLYNVLEDMLPSHYIARILRHPSETQAEHVDRVSIMFIKFVDFDKIFHRTSSPERLLHFLNRFFGQFDEICADNYVMKVETVGEEYVCAVGVEPDDQMHDHRNGHHYILGRLIRVACEILDLRKNSREDVSFQLGIHTGPVVAGVVGQKLPRFRLFGDTMNTAARMMQKGNPNRLQFGEATFAELPSWVSAVRRGGVEMKGKGLMTTYELSDVAPAETDGMQSDSGSDTSSGHLERPANSPTPTVPPRTPVPHFKRSATYDLMGINLSDRHDDCITNTASNSRRFPDHTPAIRRFAEKGNYVKAYSSPYLLTRASPRIPLFNCMRTEEDRGFRRWFHKTIFCRHLVRRSIRQLVSAFLMTAFEGMYLLGNGRAFVDETQLVEGLVRIKLFLISRLALLLTLVAQFMIVKFTNWIEKSGTWAQRWLLVSRCVLVFMMYISYDSLPFLFCSGGQMTPESDAPMDLGARNPSVNRLGCNQHQDTNFPLYGISRNYVLLSCLLVYAFILQTQPFRFSHSCAFPVTVLMIILGVQHLPYQHNSVYHNIVFKIMWFVFSLMWTVFAWLEEVGLRERYKKKRDINQTLHRVEGILDTLMPKMVFRRLRDNPSQEKPHHQYSYATVAQSDLVGFTDLAAKRSPEEVVRFIEAIFGLYDKLTDRHNIYKVETVGDAYIAGQAEEPLTSTNSPLSVVLFGLDMVEATRTWSKQNGLQVSCRVGVTTGDCVGGIVGTKMQRYHLFGALMCCLTVLESTAPPGRVQVNGACKRAVDYELQRMAAVPNSNRRGLVVPTVRPDSTIGRCVAFEQRLEPHLMTSKGEVHQLADVGGATFLASELPRAATN
jgi:class 3 adenylate cyclase